MGRRRPGVSGSTREAAFPVPCRGGASGKLSGFTLAETAVGMVVIGLLLSGVLKGQAMIEHARANALAEEMRSVFAMLHAYRSLYKAVPGDDPSAAVHVPGALGSGNGDGLIGGSGEWGGAPVLHPGNERQLFWHHLRLAGVATGDPAAGETFNAVGGRLGITSGNDHPVAPLNTSGSFFVCSANIPGKLARLLDRAIDDGAPDRGHAFAAADVQGSGAWVPGTPTATAYDASLTYTVCLAQ